MLHAHAFPWYLYWSASSDYVMVGVQIAAEGMQDLESLAETEESFVFPERILASCRVLESLVGLATEGGRMLQIQSRSRCSVGREFLPPRLHRQT